MRTDNELDIIKSLIDNTYNRFGNSLLVNTDKPFNPDNPELGYCYKYTDEVNNLSTYKIVCSSTGESFVDKRVLMHEYGHIYLLHLDGIHEELDNKLFNVIKNDRDSLIKQINDECGIDFADKLLTRIIDDPVLNHSLHNIAMDMEVNSKVLSLDDVEEMEKRITQLLPKYQEELLKYIRDKVEDPEKKKELDDTLKKMEKESKIKLIHPSRYHFQDKTPFPNDLSYPEYLLLIIKNIPEFIKMLVSIQQGGNGDTSQVSKDQIQDVLGGKGQGSGNSDQSGQDSQDQGSGNGGSMDYSSQGMQNFENLLEDLGMSDGNSQKNDQSGQDSQDQGSGNGEGDERVDSPYKGIRDNGAASELDKQGDTPGGSHRDHGNQERDKADKKRELGQINGQGGTGCGNSGGPDVTRKVDTMADEVDMALDEVIQNYSSKIVSVATRKDMMYLWNRGINRSVIAPAYRRKYTVNTNPTITFLIDISGSMDTRLVDRILTTISQKMKRIGRGLKYNIITWSTRLGEHLKDLDPRKPVPRISCGGGTEMAGGMRYFKENYGPESILILISDFEDYMEEWHKVEMTMPEYTLYGFNYGRPQNVDFKWNNFKVREFKQHRTNGYY